MKRLALLILLSTPMIRAEEPAGELSLPWTSFEDLLKLDRDDVLLTWDEFQRLLKQTGVEETPPFQMQEGKVSLSRAEFKRLLDLMKPPAADAGKYFVTKAVYAAKVGLKSTRVEARIRLQVPGNGGEIPALRVPIFPGVLAFQEVLMDGKPALIENDGGATVVTVVRSGDHEVQAVFSVGGSLEKAPYRIDFQIPRTPITRLELTIPLKDVDVSVPNASQVETVRTAEGTRVTAALPVGDAVSAAWNPVEPEKERGPAKIYSVVHNLISVEEDALRIGARIELDVLQNTVNAVNVQVPAGYNVLDVQGEAVGEWKVRGEERPVLVVPLSYARKGRFDLTVTGEQVLKEKSGVARYAGFQVLTAVRESGFVGVELKTTAEAKVLEAAGLNRLDIQELPTSLLNLAQRPLLYGFKFSRPVFQLDLDIQRHQEVAVISTVVDEANGVSLVMEDGKRVHHLTYTVRNTWKQFLELKLPEGSQVWTAFVEGRPVKPSKNADGKVLIPLNRSRAENGNLSPFDVEIMFYQGDAKLPPAGKLELLFPAPDVVVSQMLWSVYLPVSCDPLHFGGTVDQERQAQGIKPLLDVARGKRRVLKDIAGSVSQMSRGDWSNVSYEVRRNRAAQAKSSVQWAEKGDFNEAQGVDEEAYARQVEREINFFSQVQNQAALAAGGGAGGGDAGVLPIRVQVPNTGQVFRFSQRIVVDQAPVDVKVVYAKRGLVAAVKILLAALLAWFLHRKRAALVAAAGALRAFAGRHPSELAWLKSPVGLAAASLAAFVLALFLSRLLAALAFLFFLGAAGRLAWTKLEESRRSS